MKIPKVKAPNIIGKAKKIDILQTKHRGSPSDRAEKAHISKVLILSILAIAVFISLTWLILFLFDRPLDPYDILRGSASSTFAMLFAVLILDNINARSDKRRKMREERKAIIRHNKIIQPIIDMYIARKNMVITPNEKTVRKFQIDSTFTIKDMKDMYGPSELIADGGKSKIDVYSYYQDKLHEKFTHLVEDVDFNFYSDLCDAAMEYINATSYGVSALDAVRGYQGVLTGTKSMKSVVINMIKDEIEGGKYADAPPALKNVHLLHQMINEQEEALVKYLKLIQGILAEDDKETSKNAASKTDYE